MGLPWVCSATSPIVGLKPARFGEWAKSYAHRFESRRNHNALRIYKVSVPVLRRIICQLLK